MVRLLSARAPALCGLLAAVGAGAVAPTARPLGPRVADINPTVADPNPATITAVSECHMHGTVQYCQAGTTEFRISGSVTASSYTRCHNRGAEIYCRAPTGEVQIIAAQAETTPTPTQAPATSSSITAVSSCHLHGSELFCMVGTTEYEVHYSVTATQDVPPAFTGCHTHDAEMFCTDPNGKDVAVHVVGAEEDQGDHGDHGDHSGMNCHFHAGVEHCVGADGESVKTCERVDRDYNIRLRVGLLFVMLVTSSIGVFSPILLASFISPKHIVFTILRQFGTGVIISTAFIHLFTHAVLMFDNECLGELAYESTAAAILMAGLFLSFFVEYLGNRLIQWHESKAHTGSVEAAGHGHAPVRTDMVNIAVLEAGVIFHSLLIGLTLVVAGDTFFLTLFAVIVFHQMFEGLALGTRIAALGRPCPTSAPTSHGHGHGAPADGHNHAHGHEHYHTHDEQGAPVGATTAEPKRTHSDNEANSTHTISTTTAGSIPGGGVSMRQKLLLAAAFALVTPVGMAIGIGVLKQFNGNDPSTIIAIGTLDALSAGILVWVGVVEMWAHDWMLGGEMTRASPLRTVLGLAALVIGMALMSLLGKWA
ncbi:hypothetical protein VTJ49DRAFT_1720 [Mycothermus thermophilus]|uniref:Uncharacterized protein n=1 Tax=Humicola insolens TaxID=85995 RepID=A0ABR3VC03_HUMIN